MASSKPLAVVSIAVTPTAATSPDVTPAICGLASSLATLT